MNRIHISRAWCDEHLDNCMQSYNEGTGETRHEESYTSAKKRLEATGYIYTGHRRGVFTFALRRSQPLTLPLDWQMAVDAHETIDQYQDQDW